MWKNIFRKNKKLEFEGQLSEAEKRGLISEREKLTLQFERLRLAILNYDKKAEKKPLLKRRKTRKK